MGPKIMLSLRKRYKYTKQYFSNKTEEKNGVLTVKCIIMSIRAKQGDTRKLNIKLGDRSTALKSCL